MKVRKTKECGLNCESFFFLLNLVQSPESDRVQSLEQCSESNAANIKEIKREEKDIKQLYWFLPQSRSSPVPVALPRRFAL